MDIVKTVKKYGKTYRRILAIGNYPDPDVKQEAYEKKAYGNVFLRKIYAA